MKPTKWAACLLLIFGGAARADNWPAWRGPHGDGRSDETDVPVHWGPDENVRWKAPIPGTGHSSPVVWGDRVFLTTCLEAERKRVLLCIDRADGHVRWRRTVLTADLEPKHPLNSYASSTPATDGKYVWVAFLAVPNMEVFCYDLDGRLVWQKSPGEFHSRHGFCSSPVLYKDLVILNGDQDALAYVVALDRTTGAERWRADRPNRTRSYCVPFLVEAAGPRQLVLTGSKCVAGYDPDTGKQLWIIDGPTEQFVASPVYADGVLFITGGYPEFHVLGIRPDGHGNVTSSHVLWHHTRGAAYVPSPIAHGKYFFIASDQGMVSCFEARTGKPLWFERLGGHVSASPVSAGGRLYFTDDDGRTTVLRAGPRYEVIAQNRLDEPCRASPAVSGGQIFIRTAQHLYCMGGTKR